MGEKNKSIGDYPPLQAWLNKHEARFCYSLLPRIDKDSTPSIECWRVGNSVAFIVLYPGTRGWDIVTGCASNDIDKTLDDVEERVGIKGTFSAITAEIEEQERQREKRKADLAEHNAPEWEKPGLTAMQVRDAIIAEVGMMAGARTPEMQAAYDRALAREGKIDTPNGPIHSTEDLALVVRVYLDWVHQNRSPEYDIDDRVAAKKQMAVYEDRLKEMSSWNAGRGRQVPFKLTETEKKALRKASKDPKR